MQDATMMIGMLAGFLIVGIIGVYVGDTMISATSLDAAVTGQIRWYNTSDSRYITDPADPWYNSVPAGNGTWANISAAGADAFFSSQQTIVETFELGINLCKVIVIVSAAGLVFIILQELGLIPQVSKRRSGGGGGGV